jgi:hypothetical protein
MSQRTASSGGCRGASEVFGELGRSVVPDVPGAAEFPRLVWVTSASEVGAVGFEPGEQEVPEEAGDDRLLAPVGRDMPYNFLMCRVESGRGGAGGRRWPG